MEKSYLKTETMPQNCSDLKYTNILFNSNSLKMRLYLLFLQILSKHCIYIGLTPFFYSAPYMYLSDRSQILTQSDTNKTLSNTKGLEQLSCRYSSQICIRLTRRLNGYLAKDSFHLVSHWNNCCGSNECMHLR